jgi:hypothetical protein
MGGEWVGAASTHTLPRSPRGRDGYTRGPAGKKAGLKPSLDPPGGHLEGSGLTKGLPPGAPACGYLVLIPMGGEWVEGEAPSSPADPGD